MPFDSTPRIALFFSSNPPLGTTAPARPSTSTPMMMNSSFLLLGLASAGLSAVACFQAWMYSRASARAARTSDK